MSRGGGRLVSVDGLGGRARERRRTRFVTAARQDRLSRETRTQNYDVLVGSEEVSIRLAGTRGYRTPGRTASRTSRTRVARKGRRLSGTARPHRASAGTPSRRRAGACDKNETTLGSQGAVHLLTRFPEVCLCLCRFSDSQDPAARDHVAARAGGVSADVPRGAPAGSRRRIRGAGPGNRAGAPGERARAAGTPQVDVPAVPPAKTRHRPPLTPPFSARAHPQGPGGRPAHRPENSSRLAHGRYDPRPRRHHGVRGR